MIVRPLSKEKRRLFADLRDWKRRRRHGLFLLEGARAIEDALRRGHRFPFLVVDGDGRERLEAWRGMLDETHVFETTAEDLAAIAQTSTPQGVLAIGRLPDVTLSSLQPTGAAPVLIADQVRDPGNLGTLLRTLAAVGGRVALLPRGTVDAFNPKALRAAAGATLDLALADGVSAREVIDWCAGDGVPIVALEAGAPSLFDAGLPDGRVAIAVGNEAHGVSREVKGRSAAVVGLPMMGPVESLSVAIAGSIALYMVAVSMARS